MKGIGFLVEFSRVFIEYDQQSIIGTCTGTNTTQQQSTKQTTVMNITHVKNRPDLLSVNGLEFKRTTIDTCRAVIAACADVRTVKDLENESILVVSNKTNRPLVISKLTKVGRFQRYVSTAYYNMPQFKQRFI